MIASFPMERHLRYLGWFLGDERHRTLRIIFHQGIIVGEVFAKDGKHRTRVVVDSKVIAEIEYDGKSASAAFPGREGASLTNDKLKEHVSMMALLTQLYPALPVVPQGGEQRIGSAEYVRVHPPGGCAIDLLIHDEGHLVSALCTPGRRRVLFAPERPGELKGGLRFHGVWQKDAEPPIRIDDLTLNAMLNMR